MSTATRTALGQLLDELACTVCNATGCDGCDNTGQQLCEHAPGCAPLDVCGQPRPCPTHDRDLIEEATL